jgi:hypothetical protein
MHCRVPTCGLQCSSQQIAVRLNPGWSGVQWIAQKSEPKQYSTGFTRVKLKAKNKPTKMTDKVNEMNGATRTISDFKD